MDKYEDSSTDRIAGLGIDRRALISLPFAAMTVSAAARSAPLRGPSGLRSSQFPSLRDAMLYWSKVGGVLTVDVDHRENRPITMNCVPGLSYRLVAEGARSITYVGPHFHWFVCFYSEGGSAVSIDGALTLDGRNNCNIVFFARFESASGARRRNFLVDGLKVRNARMALGRSSFDGAPKNSYGATGMAFAGGFDRVLIRNVQVQSVTREARAGVTGSQGCVGIGVGGDINGTASARHVTIEDFVVANIDSDDLPGTKWRSDMDGVLVFQAPETGGSRPLIQRGMIREAAGRAIKVFAPGGGGITRDITVHRSVHGVHSGSNDVAHQHGDGIIENIVFNYSGNAHSSPSIPIGMSSGHMRKRDFPYGKGIIRNITINDTTGQTKKALLGIQCNLTDPTPRAFQISGIRDSGSAEHLFLPGGLGTHGPGDVDIDQVSVNIKTSLYASEDTLRYFQAKARRLVNRNIKPVPTKTYYDGRRASNDGRGVFVAGEGVKGFER